MHNNYYFFRLLAPALEKQLQGKRLHACFSQSKNELILHWHGAEEDSDFYIKALLNADFSCLSFPRQLYRARRNSVDLFPEVIGLKFSHVHIFENERLLLLELENTFSLLLKMHGNRANVVLMQEDAPRALFKNRLQSDWEMRTSTLAFPIHRSREAWQEAKGRVRLLYPGFSPPVMEALEKEGFAEAESGEQFRLLQQMEERLLQSRLVYVSEQRSDAPPVLSLLPSDEVPQTSFQDPLEALNEFFWRYTREYTLAREKEQVRKQLIRALRSGQNYLNKLQNRLDKLESGSRQRELADILMANLHVLQSGQKEAELFDFYRNAPVRIKLKDSLSPQKNAEVYYRKAKNQEVEEQVLKNNLQAKKQRQDELEAQLQNLDELTDLKEVRKMLKELPVNEADAEQAELLPYHEFHFQGYRILLGKSAEKNDTLLRFHTHKDDLWLHAKDVPGSHVIIKKQANQNVPALVKEKAAALAAWHSKRRNDTLCPVSCTPRKWVRKPKGAAPGLVLVEKEEQVILIPPAPFSDDPLRP